MELNVYFMELIIYQYQKIRKYNGIYLNHKFIELFHNFMIKIYQY